MTHSEYLKHIGMELRVARIRRNMSSTELAKITGMSGATILSAENGKSDVKVLTLKRMADALGVSLGDIM